MKESRALYHVKRFFEGNGRISAPSEQKCIEKTLSVYNLTVFQYLKKHKNKHIPAIYDFHEEDGKLIVREQLIEGVTLTEYLAAVNPDRKEKVRIVTQICDALAFLHRAKPPIIHRDLKPDNIMVEDNGNIILIDYDAARIYQPGESQDTEFIGTEGFAAPEQYGFGQSDARTDIYALGKLLFLMFPEDMAMHLVGAGATKLDPADRFVNIQEMKHAILLAAKAPQGLEPADPNFEAYYQELEHHYCPNCDAVLEDQPGFDPAKGVWTCTNCGMQLFGDEAGDTGAYNTGIIWYCDKCGALLNKQEGFDYYADSWTCTECGTENDLSSNNIAPMVKREK